jgi:hypothetical protein
MGRPKGSRNKPKNTEEVKSPVVNTEGVVIIKKRGRKPKSIIQEAEPPKVVASEAAVAPIKRRPGRPPKIKPANEVTAVAAAIVSAVPPIIAEVTAKKEHKNKAIAEISAPANMVEYAEVAPSLTRSQKAVLLPVQESPVGKTEEQKLAEAELRYDSHESMHYCMHEPEMEKFVELVECVSASMSTDKMRRFRDSNEKETPKYATVYHKIGSLVAIFFSLDFDKMKKWFNKRYKNVEVSEQK